MDSRQDPDAKEAEAAIDSQAQRAVGIMSNLFSMGAKSVAMATQMQSPEATLILDKPPN
jgi:hypothetical protein